MCSDYAMSFLCDILDETDKDLPKRLRNDTKEEFETLSVARWAAEELMKQIEERPFEDIEDLFGRFALDLACFRIPRLKKSLRWPPKPFCNGWMTLNAIPASIPP